MGIVERVTNQTRFVLNFLISVYKTIFFVRNKNAVFLQVCGKTQKKNVKITMILADFTQNERENELFLSSKLPSKFYF